MQNFKLFFKMSAIFIVSSILFFSGCSNSTEPSDVDGRTIHGIISNGYDNSRIDSVKVYWADTNGLEFTYTDSMGYYRIIGLTSSNEYDITFVKEGYATTDGQIDLENDGDIIRSSDFRDEPDLESLFDSASDGGFVLSVEMAPLTASASGNVYKVMDNENSELASGVTVTATFSESISPNVYTATTDTNGTYSFVNLPLVSSAVTIVSMPFSDDSYSYTADSESIMLMNNYNTVVDDLFASVTSSDVHIISNNFENDDFGVNDDIIITFSTTMITNGFEIFLTSGISNGGTDVPFTATWTNDITLTINPAIPLQAGTDYALQLKGLSTKNVSYHNTHTFETIDGIDLLWTNLERVDGLYNEFDITSPIHLLFSRTPDISNINTSITLDDPSGIPVANSLSVSGDTLIITPSANLESGQSYSLTYDVYSSIVEDNDSGSINFSTIHSEAVPTQVTTFSFEDSDFIADYNTTNFDFKWDNVAGANGYNLYAKDNKSNSDFVLVATYSANEHLTYQTESENLSGHTQFDWYNDDAVQTPLAGDTEITFGLAAFNSAGEGAITSLVISDTVAPSVAEGSIGIGGTGTSDNSSGEGSGEYSVIISCSEYLSSDFDYSITSTDATVLSKSASTFTWNADMKGLIITLSVPSGTNASNNSVIVTGLKDSSGNAIEALTWEL